MSGRSISRADWSAVIESFCAFFEPFGEVVTSADKAEFVARGTGLAIRRDGSSKSFMPLHDLEAAWEIIVFDREAGQVKLVGSNATYTYRVPPYLRT